MTGAIACAGCVLGQSNARRPMMLSSLSLHWCYAFGEGAPAGYQKKLIDDRDAKDDQKKLIDDDDHDAKVEHAGHLLHHHYDDDDEEAVAGQFAADDGHYALDSPTSILDTHQHAAAGRGRRMKRFMFEHLIVTTATCRMTNIGPQSMLQLIEPHHVALPDASTSATATSPLTPAASTSSTSSRLPPSEEHREQQHTYVAAGSAPSLSRSLASTITTSSRLPLVQDQHHEDQQAVAGLSQLTDAAAGPLPSLPPLSLLSSSSSSSSYVSTFIHQRQYHLQEHDHKYGRPLVQQQQSHHLHALATRCLNSDSPIPAEEPSVPPSSCSSITFAQPQVSMVRQVMPFILSLQLGIGAQGVVRICSHKITGKKCACETVFKNTGPATNSCSEAEFLMCLRGPAPSLLSSFASNITTSSRPPLVQELSQPTDATNIAVGSIPSLPSLSLLSSSSSYDTTFIHQRQYHLQAVAALSQPTDATNIAVGPLPALPSLSLLSSHSISSCRPLVQQQQQQQQQQSHHLHALATRCLNSDSPIPAEEPSAPPSSCSNFTFAVSMVRQAMPSILSLHQSYALGEELGRGAQGVVRICTHKITGKKFACKTVFKNTGLATNPRTEAESLMCLRDYPYIIRLEEFFEERNSIHLILELCERQTVYSVIMSAGGLLPDMAAGVMWSVAHALEFCHSRGVMHRDLKPDNIFFSFNAAAGHHVCKLGDFGLAAWFTTQSERLTELAGTLPYLAPEVLLGNYDVRAEIWSLGILMFALLTAEFLVPLPNGGNDAEQAHVLYRYIMQMDIQHEFEIRRHLICPLAKDLLTGLLQLDPRHRLTLDKLFAHPWFVSAASYELVRLPAYRPVSHHGRLIPSCPL